MHAGGKHTHTRRGVTGNTTFSSGSSSSKGSSGSSKIKNKCLYVGIRKEGNTLRVRHVGSRDKTR